MKRTEAMKLANEIVIKKARYYSEVVHGVYPVYSLSYEGQHFEALGTRDLAKAVADYIMKKGKTR